MRVSNVVEIPEPKSSGLDVALAKQFADIQRKLMGLLEDQANAKSDMHSMMLACMKDQQTSLLDAMERLMGMVSESMKSHQPSDALATALKGLKQTMASLPGDLKSSLDKQYQSVQERTTKVSVKPQVIVEMPRGFMDRIDSLEEAVVNGLRRSRNRTFGSNY